MKKFAFSLERMLNFQSQNLEKEMGILGRMTAERDALEAQNGIWPIRPPACRRI